MLSYHRKNCAVESREKYTEWDRHLQLSDEFLYVLGYFSNTPRADAGRAGVSGVRVTLDSYLFISVFVSSGNFYARRSANRFASIGMEQTANDETLCICSGNAKGKKGNKHIAGVS